MLTFLLESSVKIFLQAKHSTFQMFLFIAFFWPVNFQFRLSISHRTNPQTENRPLPVLPLCTNNALPPPWQASLITLRRAKGLGQPAASTSTVCRLQPATGLRTTARQSCNFPFVSLSWYNLIFHKSLLQYYYSFSEVVFLVETISMWKLMIRPESLSWWKHNRYSQHFKWVYFFSNWPSLLLTFS